MNVDFLADTNFLIYVHEGKEVTSAFLDYRFAVSFITEVELLGYKGITEYEEKALQSIINDCFYLDWTNSIKQKTIELRRNYRIKLPDAIIASTAILYDLPLVTADEGFTKITELDTFLLKV